MEEEREWILQGGLRKMGNNPIYNQKWHPNFNPLKLNPYEKPAWIWMSNVSMEYWAGECLENINSSLGKLMDIDMDIIDGDSCLFARLQIVATKNVPSKIALCLDGHHWIREVEIKEERSFYLKFRSWNHWERMPKKNWNQDDL